MKKILLLILLTVNLSYLAFAQEKDIIDVGFHFEVGGIYDDLRMCVATGAGVKGGPYVDICFDLNFNIDAHNQISISLPMMQPILFGIAYRVLQFEPTVNYYHFFGNSGENVRFVLGGGVGISFYSGPDYNSDLDIRGPDFFAMGPLFNYYCGITISNLQVGVRGFLEQPYLTESNDYGTVIGCALVVGISW